MDVLSCLQRVNSRHDLVLMDKTMTAARNAGMDADPALVDERMRYFREFE
jgi:hypothetical protein